VKYVLTLTLLEGRTRGIGDTSELERKERERSVLFKEQPESFRPRKRNQGRSPRDARIAINGTHSELGVGLRTNDENTLRLE